MAIEILILSNMFDKYNIQFDCFSFQLMIGYMHDWKETYKTISNPSIESFNW
jgi:hypothetical protein